MIALCVILSVVVCVEMASQVFDAAQMLNPLADSPDVAAAIADMSVTDEDVGVLRQLRGELCDVWLDATAPGGGNRKLIRPEDYIARLEKDRRWPGEDAGWDTGIRSGENPRVIARIARLAADAACSARGGEWDVIGFDYPKGSYVPVSSYGESDYVSVTLRCSSGDETGATLEVRYYRWSDGEFDTHNMLGTAEDVSRHRGLRERLSSLPSVGGRTVLLGGRRSSNNTDTIFEVVATVVENEEDARNRYPLRDSDALADLAKEMSPILMEEFPDSVLAPSFQVNVIAHSDTIDLEYDGGRIYDQPLPKALELTDTWAYFPCFPLAHVVGELSHHDLADPSDSRLDECVARPCACKEDAEMLMKRKIDVPEQILGASPYQWEITESQDWYITPLPPKSLVLRIRYGTEDDTVAVLLIGDVSSLPAWRLGVRTSVHSHARHVPLTGTQAISVYDTREGTSLTFCEADDGGKYESRYGSDNRQYAAFMPSVADDDTVLGIVQGIHVR